MDDIKESLSNLSVRVKRNEEMINETRDRNTKIEETVEQMDQVVDTVLDRHSTNVGEIS